MEHTSGGGGAFGSWTTDTEGIAAFAFEPDCDRPLIVPGDVANCWHAIGNAGITATAHAGGWTTICSTSRGVVRLTGPASSWGIADRRTEPTDPVFGMGSASWRARVGPLRLHRRIAAPNDGEPVLRVVVTIEGVAAALAADPAAQYEECWVPEPFPLLVGALMSRFEPPPPGYGPRERLAWAGLYGLSSVVRSTTDAARRLIARGLVRHSTFDRGRRAIVTRPRRSVAAVSAVEPAWFDRSLPTLFVASIDDHGVDADPERGSMRIALLAASTASLKGEQDGELDREPADREPADRIELTFAVGLARDDDDLDRLIAHARSLGPYSAEAWAGFATLTMPSAPVVERETAWHAAALVSAEQYDDHFGARYISQGSAYGFIHGLQGAPRDYALFAVPMAFLDPSAAREQLQVMMRMTRHSGSTFYAHTGRGQCTSGGLHAAPTDLPLFFLWALTEYVWSTGDAAFLDEPVPFWPAAESETATPRARAVLALRYIAERVGLGPHGLLRVGSGDWSDPISAMVADRKAFHDQGESGFNTAFAVYVLPRVAALLDDEHPDVAAEARALAAELRTAMEASWAGSWFLRGWDGRGAPIGERHLFLDGQVWALIAGIGTDEQRATLVESIARSNDDPSPIGATILDRPHDVRLGMLAPGWDCNGGVWATINALLAWGYAGHDPARAWRSLEKQSLAAHADAYPDIWYGIWSGPDAYNAHFGSRAGETFVQPATPMREFPVMNANAHAGPLLALLRVLGIETDPAGIVVRDRGPAIPPWTLSTPLGTFTNAW